jgi:plasmid stabilization system protein ParE
MIEVVWSDEAAEHFNESVTSIAQFNEAAAAKIGASLVSLAQSLERSPNRGMPGSDGARELVTGRPYIVRCSVHGDLVLIRSVRHSRRRPSR